jgi:hypothetical protein
VFLLAQGNKAIKLVPNASNLLCILWSKLTRCQVLKIFEEPICRNGFDVPGQVKSEAHWDFLRFQVANVKDPDSVCAALVPILQLLPDFALQLHSV